MEKELELVEYIYQDAEMGAYTLTKLLEDLNGKDNKIKQTVEDIRKGYERYIKDTKDYLLNQGQDLKQKGFMAKMGASMGISKEVKEDNSDARIADMLIKGLTMGSLDMEKKINDYEHIVKKDVLHLAKDFKNFQKDNIEALKKHL